MNHSREPWYVDEDGFIASGTGTKHVTVADPRMTPPGEAPMDDNAQRIVACVNACKGVSNEALSGHAGGKLKLSVANFINLEQDLADLVVFMGTVRDKIYNAESMSMDERRDLARLIEARLP